MDTRPASTISMRLSAVQFSEAWILAEGDSNRLMFEPSRNGVSLIIKAPLISIISLASGIALRAVSMTDCASETWRADRKI